MGVILSTVSPETATADLEGLKLLQVVKYYTLAILSVLVWDWIICFPSEYRRIWKSENSLVKFLYLSARYGGLMLMPIVMAAFLGNWSLETCLRYGRLLPGLALITTMSAEAILCLRVIALWQRNRNILIGLGILILVETAVMIVAVTQFSPAPLPLGGAGCFPAGSPNNSNLVILFWSAPCVVDAVLFALTVWKALEYKKRSNSTMATPLIHILLRDGSLFFAVVFAVNLINTTFYAQSNVGLQPLNSPFAVFMTNILCCRLVLNLKSSSSFSPAGHKVSNSSGRTGNHGRDDSAFRLGNGNGNSNTVKITRVGDDLSSHSVSKSMDMEGGYELGVKEIRVDIETAVATSYEPAHLREEKY